MAGPLRIVVVGGGTAGWMAANLFARQWGPGVAEVTLVESPDIGIIGVGEGSTPTLKRFFETMGIAEQDWMPACHATYKVSISFEGWSPASGIASYQHPFISQTDTFTTQAFHVNCRTRRLGLDVNTRPEDFLLNGALARQLKAPLPSWNFPFDIQYGYHFDSALLGAYLRTHAKSLGVIHREEKVSRVELFGNGEISHLVTARDERIEGDLFVDCTGFASVLLQKTLGVGFKSFRENLFNDAAVVLPTPALETLPVQTVSAALSAGWAWQIPLTHRTGNGYVYSSDHITAEQAERELRAKLQVADDVEARHLKMRVGQALEHWHANCIGLGLSQGFIEPLEATALHLVQTSIESFIEAFEKGGRTQQYRDHYNRQITARFEHVRDYIVAHYRLNTRDDSDYWRENRRNNHLSDSLRQILDVWYRQEDLVQELRRQDIPTHFSVTSWHCLLAGYGVFPGLASEQPGRGDLYREQKVAEFIDRCAVNFTDQAQVFADWASGR